MQYLGEDALALLNGGAVETQLRQDGRDLDHIIDGQSLPTVRILCLNYNFPPIPLQYFHQHPVQTPQLLHSQQPPQGFHHINHLPNRTVLNDHSDNL